MNVGAVGKRSRLTWIHPLALACVAVFISSFTIGASTQALAASSSAPAIVIVSHPQMAAILIDGKDSRLSTPAAITSLAPGPHQLSLVIPGFDPWNTSITMPHQRATRKWPSSWTKIVIPNRSRTTTIVYKVSISNLSFEPPAAP